MSDSQISNLLVTRNNLLQAEKLLCIATIENLNLEYKELLRNDFGSQLVKNCAYDIAGEVCRRYYDTSDYYITIDQMVDRILHFSYENDKDCFNNNSGIKKSIYNNTDDINSKNLKEVSQSCKNAQKQLFTENRNSDNLDQVGKKAYRESKKTKDGKLYDELTGNESGYTKIVKKNGNEHTKSDLQADHILARESITYNSKYIRQDKVEFMKKFYNSDDNFLLIHASANASKGDIRVCQIDGDIVYLNTKQKEYDPKFDITYKATPEQLAEATITQWEKKTPSGNKLEKLKSLGYLDEDGKVVKNIKEKLINEYKHTMNKESLNTLKNTDYKEVTKDSLGMTKKSVGNIIAGQVIYYVLPPLIFETQSLVRKKDMTLDKFCKELRMSGKRIVAYVTSKLGEIFNNMAFNGINKFIKIFFDIIIEMVRATIKRLIKIVKSLVLSIIQCMKTLIDKKSSSAEKADSITKILSSTITAIVMELLFEYIQKQLGLPNWLIEPLQIIVTIIATNIVMLILEKADLFNLKYGFLVSNIDKILNTNLNLYQKQSQDLYTTQTNIMQEQLSNIKLEIEDIGNGLKLLSPYQSNVINELEKINNLFNMEINFEEEWKKYVSVV